MTKAFSRSIFSLCIFLISFRRLDGQGSGVGGGWVWDRAAHWYVPSSSAVFRFNTPIHALLSRHSSVSFILCIFLWFRLKKRKNIKEKKSSPMVWNLWRKINNKTETNNYPLSCVLTVLRRIDLFIRPVWFVLVLLLFIILLLFLFLLSFPVKINWL